MNDESKVEEIGKSVITNAIKQIASEKMGKENNDSMVKVRVEPGDRIPDFAIEKAGKLGITPEGRAANGGSCGWTNLLVWQRAWCETDSGRVMNPVLFKDPVMNRLRREVVLDREEIKILKSLEEIS